MYMYTIYVDTMHKHTRFFHEVLGLPHTKDVLGPLVFYLVKLLSQENNLTAFLSDK